MKIGDEVFVHGYVDEIRKDTMIIRNEGGYFGTVPDEIKITENYTLSKDEVDNLMSDLQKGDDLLTDDDLRLLINDGINKCKEEHIYTPTKNNFDLSETGCTDKKCPFYLNPDYTRC